MFILAACLAGVLQAKVINDLNVITTEVSEQSREVRDQAIADGFELAVVRFTGLPSHIIAATIRENSLRASQYLQRYRYEVTEQSAETEQQAESTKLVMIFDEGGILSLVDQLNLPAWNNNRPELLAWIAIGDKRYRLLLGPEYESQLKTLVTRSLNDPFMRVEPPEKQTSPTSTKSASEELNPAERLYLDKVGTSENLLEILDTVASNRGLPLVLPLLDLQDNISLDTGDVWGQFVSQIREASTRYKPDLTLVGRVELVNDGWLLDWLLLDDNSSELWQASAKTLSEALVTGLEETIERIASRFAVVQDSSKSSLLEISVSNIVTIADMAAMEDYLKKQPAIANVYLSRVSGTNVRYKLELIGDLSSLLQSIQLERRLVETTAPESQITMNLLDTTPVSIYFDWNG